MHDSDNLLKEQLQDLESTESRVAPYRLYKTVRARTRPSKVRFLPNLA